MAAPPASGSSYYGPRFGSANAHCRAVGWVNLTQKDQVPFVLAKKKRAMFRWATVESCLFIYLDSACRLCLHHTGVDGTSLGREAAKGRHKNIRRGGERAARLVLAFSTVLSLYPRTISHSP